MFLVNKKPTIERITDDMFWPKELKLLVRKKIPSTTCTGCYFWVAYTPTCGLKHDPGVFTCDGCVFIKMHSILYLKEEN